MSIARSFMAIMVSGVFAGYGWRAFVAWRSIINLISNMTSGLGFEGINIAILAGNNPLGCANCRLVVWLLARRIGRNGAVSSDVSRRELVFVIQAMVLLLVTAERLLPVRSRTRESRKIRIPRMEITASNKR